MRERLPTPDRPSPRIQALDNTTTRRKRMISRTGSYRRRQFIPPSTALRRDQSTRELRHQIQDQEHTLILTTQSTVH